MDLVEIDKDGNVELPDHLEPLFQKLGMQMRFHTISGKNELLTVIHMCQIAEEFFRKQCEGKKLSDTNEPQLQQPNVSNSVCLSGRNYDDCEIHSNNIDGCLDCGNFKKRTDC